MAMGMNPRLIFMRDQPSIWPDHAYGLPVAIGRLASAHHSLHEPGYRRLPGIPAISMASRLWQAELFE